MSGQRQPRGLPAREWGCVNGSEAGNGQAARAGRGTPAYRLQAAAWAALAAVVVAWGLWCVWCYSWRELYADQWRIYRKLLLAGFPQGLWIADNAHPSVFPNLIRFYSLYAQRLNLELQVVVGMLFSVGALGSAAAVILRDRALGWLQRWMALFWVCVAIYWLANARMLMHPHESVHTYSLVWMLMLVGAGLAVGVRAPTQWWPWWACALAGVVATFCFGPGLVVPTAGAVVGLLLRLPWSRLLFLGGGLFAALGLFFLVLSGSEHAAQLLVLDAWRNIEIMGQWLSTPIAQCFFPFLDPNLAQWVPAPLSHLSVRTADAYFARYGSVWHHAWPQAAIGLTGMVILLATSFRIWRGRRQLGATQVLGLLLAWFGLGVAALISLSRLEYFGHHPDQVYANRYLPWSCLFWCGLVLLFVGNGGMTRRQRWAWQAAGLLMFAAVAVFNPVFAGWSKATHALIKAHAMAVLLDVYSPAFPQGETQPRELEDALPLLRERKLAMFAWPSANWTHRVLQPVAIVGTVPDANVRLIADAGSQAYTGTLTVPPGSWHEPPDHWVVLDGRNQVIGLAGPFAKYEPRTLQVVLRAVPLQQEFTLLPMLGDQPASQGFRLHVKPEGV